MNVDLPIAAFRDRIVHAVQSNPVTIIVSETGGGKSTQVPQYLHLAGYDVVITQPRRLAARSVAARVAEELNATLGGLVGFRTAEEKRFSDETKVLFCTDGLQLVLELNSEGSKSYVLIIDEVHEWNRNIEMLVAWVKLLLSRGHDVKVVLMSATVEADLLSKHFGGAPIISVPGRLYDVEVIEVADPNYWDAAQLARWGFASYADVPCDPVAWSAILARRGHDTLTFLPGKADIQHVADELSEEGLSSVAEILPLHGGLTPDQQQRVFRRGDLPRVVLSTNVAQTSVTIDGITAVVDGGTQKRREVRDGFEGLYLADISQADCTQRKGRAGRTRSGIYVNCSNVLLSQRDEFPVPEILRSRLDQLVLGAASIGLDVTELPFFHQPPLRTMMAAKEALLRLGALDEAGKITDIGKAMNKLPIDVHLARMIVEAEKRGVDILPIVACLQAGGIRDKGKKVDGVQLPPCWRKLTSDTSSDLLAELDCYLAASKMSSKQMRDHDINVKRFYQAKEIYARLVRELSLSSRASADSDRQEILKACVAGMVDHLYRHRFNREYVGTDGLPRQLDNNSVIERGEWVTALPFDLEVKVTTRDGHTFTKILNLLTQVTRVDPAWLVEVAPQLATSESRGCRYVPELGKVMSLSATIFNGQQIGELATPAHECPEATQALATALAAGQIDHADRDHNDEVKRQVENLSWYHSTIGRLSVSQLVELFTARLGTIYRVADLGEVNLRLEFAEFVPGELIAEVATPDPETVEVDGVGCYVTYRRIGRTVWASVQIPLDQISQLTTLYTLPKADRIEQLRVVDSQGQVVVKGLSLEDVREHLQAKEAKARQDAERQRCLDRIAQLRRRQEVLNGAGRPASALGRILDDAGRKLRGMGNYWSPAGLEEVLQYIRQAEREIERLDGDPMTVLLDELLAERLPHPDLAFNRGIRQRLDALAIRSGGFLEALTDEQLRKHYREKLAGIIRTDKVMCADLRLRLEDYAPSEILDELELAPETVELEGRKGASSYAIGYSYEEIDGQRVAVGSITVPVAVYERNCAEAGRRSSFPQLPHGARLLITVTDNNQTVACGEDGEQLKKQIQRHRKGKRRAGSVPATDELGFARRHAIEPTAPPPWFHGRAR